MRRLPTLVIALALALAPVLGLPLAAQAGGPTSVLLTRPGYDAAALYYNDGAYTRLERLVTDTSVSVPVPPELDQYGQRYNLTWLIHDQLIWRTDRIHVDGEEVYVETTMFDGMNSPAAEDTTTWHRAQAPQQLLGLLDKQLEGVGKGDGASEAFAPDLAPSATTPEAPVAETPATEPSGSALTGWVWALPGLAIGALAGVLAGRRRRTAQGPRQVLVDREPVGA